MLFVELFESPLADFGAYGNLETPGSFRSDDLKAIRSPKWREKVFRAFERSPFVFNVYVCNGGNGLVTFQRSQSLPSHTIDVRGTQYFAGVYPLSTVEHIIGKIPPNAETSITVLLAQNEGNERVSLTPWILAHRVVHAIAYAGQPGFKNISSVTGCFTLLSKTIMDLVDLENRLIDSPDFGPMFKSGATRIEIINIVAKAFGTWKSARNGNLANPGELVAEMVTQYLVKGKVILNKPIFDKEGRTPPLPPDIDEDLLRAARYYSQRTYDRNGFVNDVLESKYRYKSFPRKPNDDSYTGYDADGNAVAAFGPERIDHYKDRGIRVEKNVPTRQAIARYEVYRKRRHALEKLYDEWRDRGLLDVTSTLTDWMDKKLEEKEKNINYYCEELFKACVGKAFIL